MQISKKWKSGLFILGLIIGIAFIVIGTGVWHDIANIRLEGSEL
jgi:hypothetical protein